MEETLSYKRRKRLEQRLERILSNRTIAVKVKVSRDELKKIDRKAKKMNLKRSPYIREASLYYDLNTSRLITMRTAGQVRMIGININQIARRLNTMSVTNKILNLKDIEDDIKEYLRLLKSVIGKLDDYRS
jgi:hypothetical protein